MFQAKSGVIFGLTVGLGLSWVMPLAQAYILPADAILDSVGARRKQLGFQSLVIQGKLLNPKTNVSEKTIWKVIKPGKGVRTEVRGPHTTDITLLVGRKRFEFSSGTKPSKGKRVPADLNLDFFAATSGDTNGKRGLAFLDAYNIDNKIVSLSRMDGRIVWVIGAQANELDSPQLWVDKNLRVPVRLIYTEKESGDQVDIRLLGFGSPQTREWHPRQIDTFRNKALIERMVFHRVSINESIDSALLATPKTK